MTRADLIEVVQNLKLALDTVSEELKTTEGGPTNYEKAEVVRAMAALGMLQVRMENREREMTASRETAEYFARRAAKENN